MLKCKILALALTLSVLTACSSTPNQKSDLKDPSGNITGKSEFYWVDDNVRYATDGTDIYYLARPTFPAGYERGFALGTSECWKKVGGSHLNCYIRTTRSYESIHVRPEFIMLP